MISMKPHPVVPRKENYATITVDVRLLSCSLIAVYRFFKYRNETMKGKKQALIVFMRYPEAGKVKSRLASSLGPIAAADIYAKLLYRTLGVVDDFKYDHPEIDIFLFFSPKEKETEVRESFLGPWQTVAQTGRHLGEKMSAAFKKVRGKGYNQVVIIGTDISDIDSTDLKDAFNALRGGHFVIGPAHDGGFYLLGLPFESELPFCSEAWGDDLVFERTLRILEKLGSVSVLKLRHDIDRNSDLTFFYSNPAFRKRVSVIIPFLHEKKELIYLSGRLLKQLWPGDEVIAVKGINGSHIDCRLLHPQLRLCFSPKGRGKQMNLGARVAQGDILWFLHVDSIPPPNFAYHVRKILGDRKKVLGCFELAFDTNSPGLKAIARWANFRTRYFRLPYGDQGFFCTRETFRAVGGFRKPLLMEDVDFVKECKRVGKLLFIPRKLYSSPVRYIKRGSFRASLENHLIMTLFLLGVDDERLYRLYYR